MFTIHKTNMNTTKTKPAKQPNHVINPQPVSIVIGSAEMISCLGAVTVYKALFIERIAPHLTFARARIIKPEIDLLVGADQRLIIHMRP